MILITGPTGLVGQRLVARLADRDEVVCLVRPARRMRQFSPGVAVRVVSGDVDDPPTLRLAMHGVATIIHLAAISRPLPGRTVESVNVGGTRNVVEAAQEVGVRRIVFVSPIGADPHSAYQYLKTKGQAEELVKAGGLDYTIVRTSAVYGEGDDWTVPMAMGLRAMRLAFPIPGDGSSRLQPIFVDDLVECLVRSLCDRAKYNQTLAVGGPQILTFDEVVTAVMKAVDVNRRRVYLREPMARTIANVTARLFGRPLFSTAAIDLLSISRTTALDSVSYQFGFQPARMSDSLGYLAQSRPWGRLFLRYLTTRE